MAYRRCEPVSSWTDDELAAAEQLRAGCKRLLAECGKVIVGQHDVLEQLLIAILARGHCLLVGVPGLAKTLMIRTLADGMNLTFNRIQFTPDLMPSDITGTEILQEDKATGPAGVPVRARADLRQRRAGRRDQPHAAEDAGGAARSDAGAAGHRRRHAAPAAGPVLRAGDAEPDRAGRHVSAARRRSRTASCSTSASTTRTRTRSSASSRRRRRRRRPQVERVVSGDGTAGDAGPRAQGAGGAVRHPLRDAARPRDPADAGDGETPAPVPGLRQEVRHLGGRAAGGAEPDPGGEGAGGAARPDLRRRARTCGRSPPPVLRHRIITNFNAEADGVKPDDIVRRLLQRSRDATQRKRLDARATGRRLHRVDSDHDPLTPDVLARIDRLELEARQVVEGYLAGRHRARGTGSPSSSPSTASTPPATTSSTSTGRSTAAPSATTSSSTSRKPTSSPGCSSTPASRWSYGVRRRGRSTTSPASRRRRWRTSCSSSPTASGWRPSPARCGTFLRPSGRPSSQLRETCCGCWSTGRRGSRPTIGRVLHELAGRLGRRGHRVRLQRPARRRAGHRSPGLQHLRFQKHEVVVFHVLDAAELDFPFRHPTLFRGLEAAARDPHRPARRARQLPEGDQTSTSSAIDAPAAAAWRSTVLCGDADLGHDLARLQSATRRYLA